MPTETLVEHQLMRGFVRLSREQTENAALLHFHVEMEVEHPAKVMFEQLVLGLTDSEKSWIWPIEYENSAEPPEGGVHEGCLVKMTYRVPRFDKPDVPAKSATYSYTLAQYKPDDLLLEYQSIDHPLSGGAVVRVEPVSVNNSRIHWQGAYRQDPSQEIVVQSIIRYFPFLYDLIEQNAATGPSDLNR